MLSFEDDTPVAPTLGLQQVRASAAAQPSSAAQALAQTLATEIALARSRG